MSHLVIARKFRPQNFSSVVGQEHIRKVLVNSIKRQKVAHAYLFAGPRGVGKTSLARIFAKSLNCTDLKQGEPCLECSNCKEIAQGISLAVREIDGASHNSVENVRDLIDSFRSLPPSGSKYKIYIIDEVHMLSTSAFNALLKSLEEPPPNTVFILATTEVHKIPETVISRCQRHDFRALDIKTIEKSLELILQKEGLKAEPGVTGLIARYADGSMRDSQSLLERIISYSDEEGLVGVEATQRILGVAGPAQIEEIWDAIIAEDADRSLNLLAQAFESGADVSRFLKQFIEAIRDRLKEVITRGKVAANEVQELEHLLSMATRGADVALRSLFSDAVLEALIVRLALRKHRDSPPQNRVVTSNTNKTSEAASLRSAPSEKPSSGSGPQKVAAAPATAKLVDFPKNRTESEAGQAEEGGFSQKGVLVWTEFIRHISTRPGNKILIEHLKRLQVETFVRGTLLANGPEFIVDCLNKPEVEQKLTSELNNYSGGEELKWKISLGKQADLTGSIHHQEQSAVKLAKKQLEQSALEHPSVKSLQKYFAGSSVAKVSIRK